MMLVDLVGSCKEPRRNNCWNFS